MAHEASSIIMKRKSQLMIPEEMTSGCPMANLNDISQQLIVYLKGIHQKKGQTKQKSIPHKDHRPGERGYGS